MYQTGWKIGCTELQQDFSQRVIQSSKWTAINQCRLAECGICQSKENLILVRLCSVSHYHFNSYVYKQISAWKVNKLANAIKDAQFSKDFLVRCLWTSTCGACIADSVTDRSVNWLTDHNMISLKKPAKHHVLLFQFHNQLHFGVFQTCISFGKRVFVTLQKY